MVITLGVLLGLSTLIGLMATGPKKAAKKSVPPVAAEKPADAEESADAEKPAEAAEPPTKWQDDEETWICENYRRLVPRGMVKVSIKFLKLTKELNEEHHDKYPKTYRRHTWKQVDNKLKNMKRRVREVLQKKREGNYRNKKTGSSFDEEDGFAEVEAEMEVEGMLDTCHYYEL
jgi:hypothetical protein